MKEIDLCFLDPVMDFHEETPACGMAIRFSSEIDSIKYSIGMPSGREKLESS